MKRRCAALAAWAAAALLLAVAPARAAAPLFAQLPPEVQRAGVLRFVGDSHPPYRIVDDERQVRQGLQADFGRALEPLLGVRIEHHVVNSLSATLAGLEAGRYDVAMGPALATPERLRRFDAVSWMITRPSFVYPNDRSPRYTRVEHLCGRKVAYVAGSVTERVTDKVIDRCRQQGLPPAQHVPLLDNNMTLIATQAGRADLAGMTMTAALHAVHVNGARFGVFYDESNVLGIDLLSLFVAKRSGLAPVLLEAMNTLIRQGDYQRIMDRWGVAAVGIAASRMNASR